MGRIIAGSAVLCAMAGACVSSMAQVTITSANVATRLAVGTVITTVSDTLTTSVNIGSPGSTSWDFSGLLSHTTSTMTSVTPSTSPFIAQFPGATHVLKAPLSGSFAGLPGTVNGDLYTYLTLTSSLLINLGGMGSGTITIPGTGTFPGSLSITNSPPDTTYPLPFTDGARWGSTFTTTTIITISGLQYSNTVKDYANRFLVDAYGPMKLPDGSSHQALRIREQNPAGGPLVYMFQAADGALVQVTASNPASPDSGTIPIVQKSVTWAAGGPTSVQNPDNLPVEFSLMQNFPNPFNPSTTIRYQIAERSMVRLAVYDILGREVALLVNEEKPTGSYEVQFDRSGLSSGVYFYKFAAGSFVQAHTMIILK